MRMSSSYPMTSPFNWTSLGGAGTLTSAPASMGLDGARVSLAPKKGRKEWVRLRILASISNGKLLLDLCKKKKRLKLCAFPLCKKSAFTFHGLLPVQSGWTVFSPGEL